MPRLLSDMDGNHLDAVVAASPDNFFYMSGARILSQVHIRDRLALSITTADGATTLVVNRNEEGQTRRQSWVDDVRTYVEFVESPMKIVAEVVEEKGLSHSRLGLEKKFLTAAYYEDLAARLPNATLLGADAVFDRARMIKTPLELEALRLAARSTDEAISRALRQARAGDPEHQLARWMSDALFEIGKGEFRDISWGVASGPNIATTHYWAGDRQLSRGELVRINLRSALRGYYSHLYRMAVVEEANPRRLDWYMRARDIQYRSIERLRPGVRSCDLYQAAKEDMERQGIQFSGAHVGHSTGIALHENPRLQPLDETVLEPGMVIAAEPSVRDPDDCVYHLEDLVLVTEDKPIVLSDVTNTEKLIVIGI